MRIKRKNGLKVVAITIALLLCLALAVGITGALYQAKRQATGTLSMDQGIIIDYKGFNGSETGATWERGTTFELFSTKAGKVQPGAHIKVNPASIKANAKSVNFYARVRLEYKFYNGEVEVTLEDPTVLIKASNLFGSNWEFSSMAAPKDYYYYVENGTTTFKTMQAGADFVELIQSNAEFIIEGEGFKGSNDLEGGGFVVDETTSINKIVVNLVLETLQGEADPATEGWKFATPVRFAEATGKMETSVNKTETTEDLNVSVAGATEVPINEVVFPYDTPTTLKFDSNNVEYITLTYDKDGVISTETFEETALNTITVKADSGKGKVTGYTVGLWNDSEYTGFTYKKTNSYESDHNGTIVSYDVDGLVVAGYFGSDASITIPAKVKVRNRDFKLVINYSSWDDWSSQIEMVLFSVEYPCKIDGKTYADMNVLLEDIVEDTELSNKVKNGTFPNSMTITYNVLCETTSILYSTQNVKEIGFGLFGTSNFAETRVAIENITISEGIEVIGSQAFRNSTSLVSVTIPNSVKKIYDSAFSGCTNLTTITIPSSVDYIGNFVENLNGGCFNDCTNLTTTVGEGWVYAGGGSIIVDGQYVSVTSGETVDPSILLKNLNCSIKRA